MLGVHPMTVSRWERGAAQPTPYQVQQLRLLDEGADTMDDAAWRQFQNLLAMGLFVGALALVIAAAVTLKRQLDES